MSAPTRSSVRALDTARARVATAFDAVYAAGHDVHNRLLELEQAGNDSVAANRARVLLADAEFRAAGWLRVAARACETAASFYEDSAIADAGRCTREMGR